MVFYLMSSFYVKKKGNISLNDEGSVHNMLRGFYHLDKMKSGLITTRKKKRFVKDVLFYIIMGFFYSLKWDYINGFQFPISNFQSMRSYRDNPCQVQS